MAKGNKKITEIVDASNIGGKVDLLKEYPKIIKAFEDIAPVDSEQKVKEIARGIQKLNEELTDENTNLLQKIDELNDDISNSKYAYELIRDIGFNQGAKILSLESELSKIKSKWWYKLINRTR